ncbi:hypothetical protein OROHE_003307 [Orobanche hederae]
MSSSIELLHLPRYRTTAPSSCGGSPARPPPPYAWSAEPLDKTNPSRPSRPISTKQAIKLIESGLEPALLVKKDEQANEPGP